MTTNDNLNELTETLMGMARNCASIYRYGNVEDIQELLTRVKGLADEARGTELQLLQVAKSFIRAFLHGHGFDTTQEAKELFRLVQSEEVLAALEIMVRDGSIKVEDTPEDLKSVLREPVSGRYYLPSSLRRSAEDLVLHPMFRHWERVNEALKLAKTSDQLASMLGVSRWETKVFLNRSQT